MIFVIALCRTEAGARSEWQTTARRQACETDANSCGFTASPHATPGCGSCPESSALLEIQRLAEREGFEPSIRFCRILTFQASAFDHSATAPHPQPDGYGIPSKSAWKAAHLRGGGARGKVAGRNDRP